MTKQERFSKQMVNNNINPIIYVGLYENARFAVDADLHVDDPQEVIKRVAMYFNLDPEDVKGDSRKKELVIARQFIMFLLYNHTQMIYKAIGKLLGNRDHSTVVYACKTVEEQIQLSKLYKKTFTSCCTYVFGNIPYMINKYLQPIKPRR